MSSLAKLLAEHLSSELAGALSGASGSTLRVFFSGPPKAELDALFQELTRDEGFLRVEVGDRTFRIAVYLLEHGIVDPTEVNFSARCTESFFVGAIRNNVNVPFSLALQDHVSAVQSVDSTVTRLGIGRQYRELSHWINSSLIQDLLSRILAKLPSRLAKDRLDDSINLALKSAWEADEKYHDKRFTWNVLSKLSDYIDSSSESEDDLSAYLGLFKCDADEFGGSNHLSMPSKLGDFLNANGLQGGLVEISKGATDEVKHSLLEFWEHLEFQGVMESGDFSKNPAEIISRITNDRKPLPDWFNKLTVHIWSELLDVEPEVDPDESLVIEPLDTFADLPKNLPHVSQSSVRFRVIAPGNHVSIELKISRSNGSAAWTEHRTMLLSEDGVIFEDNAIPEHQGFIRYKIEALGFSDAIVKFIVLDSYGPGILINSRTATTTKLFKRNKKAKDEEGNEIDRYESDVVFSGMGSHQIDFYSSRFIGFPTSIIGYDIDAEQDGQLERPLNPQDDSRAVCLIETDEECHYDFTAVLGEEQRIFRIYITAEDQATTGVESEFDRLVLSHRSAPGNEHSSARVEPSNRRLATIEEWILESNDSCAPLVLGPDFLDCWRKPDWRNAAVLSNYQMLVDPRPTRWLSRVPAAFKEARLSVFNYIRDNGGEVISNIAVHRLHEYMRDPQFVDYLGGYVDAYCDWLAADYENAVWTDTISILDLQRSAEALNSDPFAVLLSPYHPVRLAWQCQAQSILQSALEQHDLCPAASTLTPSQFPDCMLLGCESASGAVKKLPFISMTTSNDYWSVMWSVDRLGGLNDIHLSSVISYGLGISIQGISSGFSAQQVVRSMDEVSRLTSARSTLRLGLTSDEAGGSNCNDGIQAWSLANLGPDADEWHGASPKSLVIVDRRTQDQQPEQSILSSLTYKTHGAVKWYTASDQPPNLDLSIVAHLGTMNHEFTHQSIRSAVDYSGLLRWRVRKQQAGAHSAFVGESLVGKMPTNIAIERHTSAMLRAVDNLENMCGGVVDSYVFAPNLAALEDVVANSSYTAVSSSNVDAACFFGATKRAYLWDYELPSYSARVGENSGYFLLASQTEGMIRAVRSALKLLDPATDVSDLYIENLLVEISKRGMPTLKRLTGGGTLSMGELGMLVALRMLQYDFIRDRSDCGVLPVFTPGHSINLVVPADPFQHHFEDLRKALQGKSGERPDMLVLSIAFLPNGDPASMRITPIEVKARKDVMTSKDRATALTQASHFANFLQSFQSKAKVMPLWGVAWRGLLSAIIDYGFRVYGQLDHLMAHAEWAASHAQTLQKLADDSLAVEIDHSGRQIIVDGSSSSFPVDVDGDSYYETVVISHKDALLLLSDEATPFLVNLRSTLESWDLVASLPDEVPLISPPTISNPETTDDGRNYEPIHEEAKDQLIEGGQTPEPDRETEPANQQLPSEKDRSETIRLGGDHDGEIKDSSLPKKLDLVQGIKFDIGKSIGGFSEENMEFFPGNTALNQLNIGIVGDLGTGKTQLIQALIYQLRQNESMNRGKKPNVLIFDYKRDYSKKSFVDATGAKVVSPFDIPLNLFDTRDSLQERNSWLERSKFFSDVLGKIYQGIGPAQREYIKRAVKQAYERSASIEGGAPTIADVFENYAELRGNTVDSPYSIMSDMVDGGYFVSDHERVVPFSQFLDGIVVLDLSAVGQDDRTKNMLVVIFLNLFYEHMLKIEKKEFIGSDPTLRFVDTMLLVDEADNIMQYEFDVLKKILLQGREFGVGVLLASQYLSHFKTTHENYLEPLLTWFIHKVPNIRQQDLESIGLTNANLGDLVDRIRKLECHECLYKSLNVDGGIIRANPFFELTDPSREL